MGKLRDFFSFQDTVSNEVLESQRKKHAELIYQLKGQLEVRDLNIGIHLWYKTFWYLFVASFSMYTKLIYACKVCGVEGTTYSKVIIKF